MARTIPDNLSNREFSVARSPSFTVKCWVVVAGAGRAYSVSADEFLRDMCPQCPCRFVIPRPFQEKIEVSFPRREVIHDTVDCVRRSVQHFSSEVCCRDLWNLVHCLTRFGPWRFSEREVVRTCSRLPRCVRERHQDRSLKDICHYAECGKDLRQGFIVSYALARRAIRRVKENAIP